MTAEGDVPESVLVEAADELFQALDAEEERNAKCSARGAVGFDDG